ncbi:MAG: SusC/RagA family TonB-linked outer membrane protein [Niabella sp.]
MKTNLQCKGLRYALFLLVLCTFSQVLTAQQNTPVKIEGTVLDDAATPVSGASVQLKGTQTTVVSDDNGAFSLMAPIGSVLIVSNIAFETQEVVVTQRQLTIVLKQRTASLDEVVVVGYGTQRKSDVTGALTRVSADVIQERPAQNVLQALQGKASGVNISSNMKPGELPVLRVRGNRSLTASNDPLYVVDGIPLVSILGVNSFSVNDLNPNDIESVEILKDASATAIYGSRGANGVVLITTNKGKKGRVSIGYNGTLSFDSFKELTDWSNGGEYIDYWRQSLINGYMYQSVDASRVDYNKKAPAWYPDPFLDMQKMTGLTNDQNALASVMQGYEWEEYLVRPRMRPTTAEEKAMGWPDEVPVYNSENIRSFNWRDAAVRTGMTQNHQLSLTAGTDISRFALSLGYFNQKGVQRDQDYRRYTVNVGGDITPVKWLTVGTSIIGSFAHQNFGIQGPNTSNTGSKDLYSRATDQFPYAVPRDSSGAWIYNPGGNLSLWNPLIDIDQAINDRRTTSVLTNIFSEVKFTDWLKYRINIGVQYRQYRAGSWTGPNATSHLTNRPSTAGYATEENSSWVIENLLFFDKQFGDAHRVGVTLLQSAQRARRENTSTTVNGTINPLSYWYDLNSNTVGSPSGYGTGFTENTLTSFMGRINYTILNKYLLTASGRMDGASVLAPGNKWDFFPSFALAWKMQEESFLRNVDWITELKPRIGYGVTGNSSVSPYSTSGPLSRNPYLFGSVPAIGYLPQLVQNPLLSWEKTAQINVGLDFNILKSRISGSLEYYTQNTSDLIMTRSLPAVSGYVQKVENVGKTKNSGLEFTLSTVNIDKEHFTWSTDLNWSNNKEEIVELINGKEDMVANRLFIGQPIQVFYEYAHDGVWSSSDADLAEMAKFNANGHKFRPGTVRVVDQNGDYKIDGNDYVVLGAPRPKWTGGITNTFRYKSWELSAFVYFRWGQMYFGGYPGASRVETDYWSWENQNGKWPMPNANTADVQNLFTAM